MEVARNLEWENTFFPTRLYKHYLTIYNILVITKCRNHLVNYIVLREILKQERLAFVGTPSLSFLLHCMQHFVNFTYFC